MSRKSNFFRDPWGHTANARPSPVFGCDARIWGHRRCPIWARIWGFEGGCGLHRTPPIPQARLFSPTITLVLGKALDAASSTRSAATALLWCGPLIGSRATSLSFSGVAQPDSMERRQFCARDEKLEQVALDHEVAKSMPLRSTCSCISGWNGLGTCPSHISGGAAPCGRALTRCMFIQNDGLVMVHAWGSNKVTTT